MEKIIDLFSRERNLILKKRVAWCLVIGWIFLIFSFSSDPAEVSREKSIIVVERVEDVVEAIEARMPTDYFQINNLHRLVRKKAHAFLYFTLTLFIITALHFTGLGGKRKYLYSGLIALLCASLDETYQNFIPGRSGEVMDVFIDGIGITIAILLSKFTEDIYRRKNRAAQDKKL
ncbi:MAG: VanZ family protein [Clostridiaceae bacterium]|nr:VanZ family protein [Clostridiaceae bacterium]